MNDTPASREAGGKYVTSDGEELLPLRKARKELGISRSTAYRWRDEEKLTFLNQDGRIFCPASQVEELKAKEAAHAGH